MCSHMRIQTLPEQLIMITHQSGQRVSPGGSPNDCNTNTKKYSTLFTVPIQCIVSGYRNPFFDWGSDNQSGI